MAKDDPEFEDFKSALGLYVEDPWERVKFIFLKNDYGERHPDFQNTLQATQMGFLVGAVLGGSVSQSQYIKEIKEKSDAKMYHNKFDAYREISRESLQGFLKGSVRWGPRVAAFTGGFTLFTSCVEAYRNKTGVIEYSVSGSMIGSILRLNFGLRGMLVGGLVGSVLGTIYGLAHLGLCKLSGNNGIQLKYAQFALAKYIDKQMTPKAGEAEQILGLNGKVRSQEMLNPLDALSLDNEEQAETEKKEKVK